MRVAVGPLHDADHAAYLALLDLTTSGGGLPAGIENLITLPGFDPPSTHGPAMCLSAHLRRHPTPVGALFAAVPEWAMEHTLGTHRARLAGPLSAATISIYGLAVAAEYRGRGIARALLREAETRARATRCRLATLIHEPHLASFYQRMGYTTATQPTVLLPGTAMLLTQPAPYMTAVKPLHPTVRLQPVPGAPGPVVTGLLPGCDLPPTARFGTHVVG
ncbi:GNAT family N-acetyltransferase (plasmid) [Streptomyces zhihengii]|uniref:GNAT family N-acetyltransferase n=1 Tax=Streptomyces zhihengii TaxID=1818004 RepID=A0ABS2V4N7_9ACTN|nr:GNAT family N-acetyltransferase [Streptomyces zhihengii]MBM9624730.1 GNAT family N-acetyltransferase [Streptomyces zhihengii]